MNKELAYHGLFVQGFIDDDGDFNHVGYLWNSKHNYDKAELEKIFSQRLRIEAVKTYTNNPKLELKRHTQKLKKEVKK